MGRVGAVRMSERLRAPGEVRSGSLRLVLLDRDGVLNRRAPEGRYVLNPNDVRLLPGAARAVGALTAAGVLVAVVSNQRSVALGLVDLADVQRVSDRIDAQLVVAGGRIASWHICPHAIGSCRCRKPLPGLLLAALKQHGVAPEEAVMIGDQESDIVAGHAAGVATVRLAPATTVTTADWVAPDLLAAVGWLRISTPP